MQRRDFPPLMRSCLAGMMAASAIGDYGKRPFCYRSMDAAADDDAGLCFHLK